MAWISVGTFNHGTPLGGTTVKFQLWTCSVCGAKRERLLALGPPSPAHFCAPGQGEYHGVSTGDLFIDIPQDPTENLATPGCRCSGCKIKGWR